MNTFQWMLIIGILLLAFPLGIVLARMTTEELKVSRKAFKALIAVSLLAMLAAAFLPLQPEEKILTVSCLLFIIILTGISLWKGMHMPEKRKRQPARKQSAKKRR